jgi:predicted AlkP superfamily phosphohydrolase/phosphomutase
MVFIVFLGILLFYGYLYYRKSFVFLLVYFLCLAAGMTYVVKLRTKYPIPIAPEKTARLEAKEINKGITIIGMRGLSFDFIIPFVNEEKLPNFEWLMEEGSWGRLTNFSPNDSIILNTSFNTGKLPAKHLQLSSIKFRLQNIKQEIEVVPRFILFRQIARLNLLESYPYAPKLLKKDIWQIFEDNKISYIKEDPPYCIEVESPSENTESVFNRFYKDYKFETGMIFEELQRALLSDIECEEKFTQSRSKLQSQLSYLLLNGLNIAEAYFYKYNFPDLFGDIDQEEITKYSTVIENYYQLYDQVIGKHLATMKEDELLVVYSPHGIEPLPIWERMVRWIFGDHDISAYHEKGPEGVVFFYGKNIIRGRHIEEMRLIDIAPTLLNYLELPVGKDMDGIVNSTMFMEGFKVENPVLYITSYEEVEIKAPEE